MSGTTSPRRALAAGVGALVLAAVAACSSGGPPEDPAGEAWLGRVCGALGAGLAAGTPPEVDGDQAASRDRMLPYLADRQASLDRAAGEVEAAGPAPVAGQEELAANAVGLLRDRAEALRANRDALAAATGGPALTQGLQSTVVLLTTTNETGAVASALALPPQLASTADRVPACGTIGV